MRRAVYIIGTGHDIQYGRSHPDERFYDLLVEACQAHAIQVVAEEAPEDVRDITQTVPARVAKSLGLHPLPCDPDKKMRKQLGIVNRSDLRANKFRAAPEVTPMFDAADCAEINRSDRIREGYWIDRLLELDVWPVLFVCGALHSLSLCIALQERGLEGLIAEEDWECR
jgi:hypothetical protein